MLLHGAARGKRAAASAVPGGAQAAAICGLPLRLRGGLEGQSLGTFCLGIPAGAIGAWL